MLEYGILQIKQKISDISAIASGEYSLEITLAKIKRQWESMSFTVIAHQSDTTFILGGVDEVITTLEDNQVTLQAMSASRFIMGIREEVQEWEKRLSCVSEILDEWLYCQRQWLYLEAIFSQSDIQKQLPDESGKFYRYLRLQLQFCLVVSHTMMTCCYFYRIDRIWKEFMRKTKRSPAILETCTSPITLTMFNDANRILEEIQKGLERYLETKRMAFPRFYFLSNEDLLDILGQTQVRDISCTLLYLIC